MISRKSTILDSEKMISGAKNIAKHAVIYGAGIASAFALAGCDQRPNSANGSDLADKLKDQKPIVRVKSNNHNEKSNGKYSFLGVYDNIIKTRVSEFNRKHNINLDSDLIKAMIVVESGGERVRNETKWDNACDYDPMQIANNGDYALEGLAKGVEDCRFVGNFDRLKDERKTPWNKQRKAWDYSNTNMSAEESIYGGIGWLLNKAVENVEEGPITKYEVKPGDSLSKIAVRNGSTLETLKRVNKGMSYDRLQIGQKINFRFASRKFNPRGVDWKEAVKDYNGGGDSHYVEKVFGVLGEIKNEN